MLRSTTAGKSERPCEAADLEAVLPKDDAAAADPAADDTAAADEGAAAEEDGEEEGDTAEEEGEEEGDAEKEGAEEGDADDSEVGRCRLTPG